MAHDIRRFARLLDRVSRDIVTSPVRWRSRQWVLFLAVVATTWLAYVEKRSIQPCVQRGGGSGARALALLIDACGGGFAVTLLGFAALVAGRWARKRALVDAALVLGVAGVWCWIFTKTGQLVLAERRPNDGGTMKLFALGGHGVSGHAAAAALLFSPVRDVLARGATPKVRRVVTAALLAWAVLVGWSRVWLGMHFVWNVMLGFAMGVSTGLVAARAGGRARMHADDVYRLG
jgi:membrane-associated phospholipid phosphatase